MDAPLFYRSRGESLDEDGVRALVAEARREPRILLPAPLVHPAARGVLAARAGLTRAQLDDVVCMAKGLDGGRVFEEFEGFDNDDPRALNFGAYAGAAGLARAGLGELLVDGVPLRPENRRVLDSPPLHPPPDRVEQGLLALMAIGHRIERLRELNAPSILIRQQRWCMQDALDTMLAGESVKRWRPLGELMTGRPPDTTRSEAPPAWLATNVPARSSTEIVEARELGGRLVVITAFAGVVLSPDGRVLDCFPARGCSAVAAAGHHLMLFNAVGYSTMCPSVRDVRARRWIEGPVPPGLPRYFAGAFCDVKWTVAVDLHRGLGYRLAPYTGSDASRIVLSEDGRYVWDTSTPGFVDLATGEAVLDMRGLEMWGDEEITREWELAREEGEEVEGSPPQMLCSAVRRASGAWRLVTETVVHAVQDGRGAVVREHRRGARVCMDPGGERLTFVDGSVVGVEDVDSGRLLARFELSGLMSALGFDPGEGVEYDEEARWSMLMAAMGWPAAIGASTIPALREATETCFHADDLDDAFLRAAIERHGDAPPPPERVPVTAP